MRDRPKIKHYDGDMLAFRVDLNEWSKEAATEIEVLKLLITKREQLQLEYIKLLGDEIHSAASVAFIHGWRSENAEKGNELREKLKLAGCDID